MQTASVNMTRDGVLVAPGQVWRDLDKRVLRTVTVERVSDGTAFVVSSINGARTRIAIRRMHKYGQGFELVSSP